jgi:hypothetical protein
MREPRALYGHHKDSAVAGDSVCQRSTSAREPVFFYQRPGDRQRMTQQKLHSLRAPLLEQSRRLSQRLGHAG